MGTSYRKAGSPTEYSVKVGKLPQTTTVAQLRSALENVGITSMTDVYIPKGKLYGFVRFRREEEAQSLASLPGIFVEGVRATFELTHSGKRRPTDDAPTPGATPTAQDSRADGSQQPTPKSQDVEVQCWADLEDDDENELLQYVMNWSKYQGGSQATAAATNAAVNAKIAEVSVKVGNLPPNVDEDDLVIAMCENGIHTMTDCYIPQQKFGFLRFATEEEAQCVLTMQAVWRGRQMVFELAKGRKKLPDEMRKVDPEPGSTNAQIVRNQEDFFF